MTRLPYPLLAQDFNTVVHSWEEIVKLLTPFHGEFQLLQVYQEEDGSVDLLIKEEDGTITGCFLSTNTHQNHNYFLSEAKHAKAMYELAKDNPEAVIYFGEYRNYRSFLPAELLKL